MIQDQSGTKTKPSPAGAVASASLSAVKGNVSMAMPAQFRKTDAGEVGLIESIIPVAATTFTAAPAGNADPVGTTRLNANADETVAPFTAPFKPHAIAEPVQDNVPVQRMKVVQRTITDSAEIGHGAITQHKTNSCWAATGWWVHTFHTGGYASEALFVAGHASPYAKGRYTQNKVCDIDQGIGSKSKGDHFNGCDDKPPFAESYFDLEIGTNSLPIIANVNADHYVIICGKRKNNGAYELKVMDPGDGSLAWLSTTGNNNKITKAGAHTLSVLYFTKKP
jgi:hypothetical protein